VLETEIEKLKLSLQTEKESHNLDQTSSITNITNQSKHVHDMSVMSGELKQKLLTATNSLEMSKAREIELMAKAQAAVERLATADIERHEAEDKMVESNARCDIAEAALATSSAQISELESQCVRLRNEVVEIEKQHAEERAALARLKLRESYEDEEAMILKNKLRGVVDSTSREERELKRTIAELTGQVSVSAAFAARERSESKKS
jgi:hypothetical protein